MANDIPEGDDALRFEIVINEGQMTEFMDGHQM
jgi:hypothetical protein